MREAFWLKVSEEVDHVGASVIDTSMVPFSEVAKGPEYLILNVAQNGMDNNVGL